MKISDINNKLDLHLKDYCEIRKDLDGVLSWLVWVVKLIIGAIILSILTLIGLKK